MRERERERERERAFGASRWSQEIDDYDDDDDDFVQWRDKRELS